MASDRNIIEFNNGQVASKSYGDIFNMLVTNMRAIYGQDIDISVESPQGQELRFLARLFEEFSSVVGSIFNTFNIYQAEGWHLDRLIKFATGMSRLPVDYTKISSIVVVLPANAIDLVVHGNKAWSFLDANGIKWLRLADAPIIESPTDTFEISLVCNSSGPHRLDDTSELTQLYVAGQFITDNITISGIPVIKSVGSYAEEDRQYLTRMLSAAAVGSRTLVASIKESLFSIMPGTARDVVVINSNNGDGSDLDIDVLTDDNGVVTVSVPNHDVFVIVQPVLGATIAAGSNDEEIAKVIQNKMTPGISTMRKELSALDGMDDYLTYELPVDDRGSLMEVYRFKVATIYDPIITINLKEIGAKLGSSAKTLLEQELRDKITNLSFTYIINQPINITAIRNLVGSNANYGARYIIDDSVGISIDVKYGVDVKYGYWQVMDPNNQILFVWSI